MVSCLGKPEVTSEVVDGQDVGAVVVRCCVPRAKIMRIAGCVKPRQSRERL
ncbi:MAG: hypothetical protein QOH35_219 [Acidobacteriaceae bacterium]|nr:hypothetical protein [Acidobacteriaceae bacterium]